MVSRQDATLNLTSLLRHSPGAEVEVRVEGSLAPEEASLVANGLRLQGPLNWALHVVNAGGDDDFVVTGEVRGTALLECRRCLVDVPTPIVSSFVYPMRYRAGDATAVWIVDDDETEDVLEFAQPLVDFAELLTQVFAIDLPVTALCREDCKGLSLDGVNLNEHPDHVAADGERTKGSPFASLKDLDL